MKGSITKKIIAIVLTLTMVATMNVSVFAADTVVPEAEAVSEANAASDQAYTDAELEASGECGNGAYYYLYADGTFVLKAGDGATVPATVSSDPWNDSKQIQESIKHLIIDDSIEDITDDVTFGYEAGVTCYNLETVTFPQSFKSIPGAMFYSCSNLEKVIMPMYLEEDIGGYAFADCSSLKSIVLPKGCTGLGQYVFNGCSALKQVELCDGLYTIPGDAFGHCSSLESIDIPNSVRSISAFAFFDCNQLKDVKLPEELDNIGSYAFASCNNLNILCIPNDVRINDKAFAGLENIKLIVEQYSEAHNYAIRNKIPYSFVHVFFDEYQEYLNPNEKQTLPLVCFYADRERISVPAIWATWESSDTNIVSVENGVITGGCPGTATITAYYDEESVSCEITVESDISAIDFNSDSRTYSYTGKEICPDVTATVGNYTLTKGHDYTLQYDNNVDPGVATIIVKGIGRFSGEKNVDFYIDHAIDASNVTVDTSKALCTGEPITKSVTVKLGSITLVEGKDYTVSYENNMMPGTATIIVEGIGNYGGRVIKEFAITCNHAAKYVRTERREATCTAAGCTEEVYCPTCKTVQVKSQAIPATGHAYKETIEVATPEKDGVIKNICVNCNDIITKKIAKISDVELSSNEVEYTGETYTPAVTVKDAAGKAINADDFLVTYGNGFKLPGTYTVKVDFINNYSGSVTKTFVVTKGTQVIDAADVTITVGKAVKKLNAKRTAGDGKLSYTSSNKKVAAVSSTGKVTPKTVGKTTITITAKGTEKYKKTTKKITVSVVPKGTKLSGLKTTKNGSITASWKKASGINGYQLRYSANSNMRNAVTVGVSGAAKTSVKKAGLSKGQKYYVQIRTYKTVNGQKLYSEWSGKKSITTMNAYLNVTNVELEKGFTKKLSVKNRAGKKIKWNSSNKSIATVSASGKIVAKKVGSCTITAKVGEQKLTCKVKVTPKKYMTVNKTSVKLTKKDSNATVKVTFKAPGNWTVSHKSKNKNVATCKWGKWNGNTCPLYIYPKGDGTTYVHLTNTYNSQVIKIKVVVDLPEPEELVKVKLDNSHMPQAYICYDFDGDVQQLYHITGFEYWVDYNKYYNDYSISVKVSGKKYSDQDGPGKYRSIRIMWELYDEDGGEVDSGVIYTPQVRNNDTFVVYSDLTSGLKEGTYTMKFFDCYNY